MLKGFPLFDMIVHLMGLHEVLKMSIDQLEYGDVLKTRSNHKLSPSENLPGNEIDSSSWYLYVSNLNLIVTMTVASPILFIALHAVL